MVTPVVVGATVVVVAFGAVVVVVRGRVVLVVGGKVGDVVVGGLCTLVVVVVGATVEVVAFVVVGEAFVVVGEGPPVFVGLVVVVSLVVDEALVATLGLVVVEDLCAADVVVTAWPPFAPAPPAATAGSVEVGGKVPGGWVVEDAWLVVGANGAVPDRPEALWSTPAGGDALVATPAIDAATTVATSTRDTTSTERSPDALGLRRNTGTPRRLDLPWRRPGPGRAPNAVPRLTRRLTLRGWPRGAKAPSMATVSFERSSVGTSRRTGQPLTISSSNVAGRPSGVRPTLRTTSSPPMASHGHRRSTVGSSMSVSVQPVGSTRRSKEEKLAPALPGSPSTTHTFGSFTLRTFLVPSPQHRPPRFRMLRVERGSWKSNHDP